MNDYSRHSRRARAAWLVVWSLACLALAGCATPKAGTSPERGPLNVRAVERWPEELTRVAVLPAHDASGRLTPEFTAGLDAAWDRALAETRRAEWVRVDAAALAGWTGRGTWSAAETLPADLPGRIAARSGAQAVLFLELTQVSPYPPLVLAFRARLTAVESGATLWAVDEIFDARDAATARAVLAAAGAGRAANAGDVTHAALQSPTRFADHAFRVVADTLPPRRVAPTPETETKAKKDGAEKSAELGAKRFPVRADNSR
ncbi:MAG: hypothetical protein MUE42_09700 [Opitutaceae bacterium]|nr:hypothetical protein [Opitutaceae bacterium]